MKSNLDIVLDMVNKLSVDELEHMSREVIIAIMQLLGPDFPEFLFAKNVKIFGGINGYVEDFLNKGTVNIILAMQNSSNKPGAIRILKKMETYPGVSDDNKLRIRQAISRLLSGGSRSKRNYKSRRNRRK